MSNDYLISQVEFARLMGVTKQAVSKAVKEGRIKLILDYTDGKLKLNPDLAAKQWRENSLPRVENAKITNPFKGKPKEQEPPSNDGGGHSSTVDDDADLIEAKTEKERYQAKLLELQFKEKMGELLSSDKVKKEAFKLARLTRDAILNVPGQICNELAIESDPFIIHQKLTISLTKALEELVMKAQSLTIETESEEENEEDELIE